METFLIHYKQKELEKIMIQIKLVLPEAAECFMCKKPRQVALVTIDGPAEVQLCFKHIQQLAELQSQSQQKEKS